MNEWEIGVFSSWDEESEEWLQKGDHRKAIVVGLVSEELPPHAMYFPAPTWIHRQMAVQKVGQISAFSELKVFAEELEKALFHAKLQAELRLSELADLGVRNLRHLLQNGQLHLSSLTYIQQCFANLPAVIIGAGFSLQDLGETLQKIKGKALLIAAGSGLKKSPIQPDLAFISDPHTPLDRSRYPNTPLCIQGKVHPDTLQNPPATILYAPDSTLPLEGWLMDDDFIFDGGWNGANGAVEVAHLLGCAPIYLAGVDLCYEMGKKYFDEEITNPNLIDFEGKKTQRDWALAAMWLREKQAEYQIFNLSKRGLDVAPVASFLPVEPQSWALPESRPIRLRQERLLKWKEALLSQNWVAEQNLLEPVWSAWRSLFEREESDMEIQKKLFCNRIAKEHLDALKTEKISYYSNGQIKTIQRFFAGERDGETTLYWANGKVKRRVVFQSGKRLSDEYWDLSGVSLA